MRTILNRNRPSGAILYSMLFDGTAISASDSIPGSGPPAQPFANAGFFCVRVAFLAEYDDLNERFVAALDGTMRHVDSTL